MIQITKELVAGILRPREKNSHKGDYGKDLIMAGSRGMAGAAVMCGLACLRSGAGLVRFYVPDEIFTTLQIAVPQATCIDRTSDMKPEEIRGCDAIAIGPGLGNNPKDAALIEKILTVGSGALVLDADGLNNVIRYDLKQALKESRADKVITPHPGEGARFLGVRRIEEEDRADAAHSLSQDSGATAVLKGAETLVACKDGKLYINNTTGNPGMATGGSGDVLTGMITGLMGQGYKGDEAAVAAVYLHGRAGDMAAEHLGVTAMTAMDIIDYIPAAFTEMGI